jgi:hypothetical protein
MRMLCSLVATALLLQPVYATPAGDGQAVPTADPSVGQADAVVTLKGGLVSAGIGYGWGHGTVTYRGQEYAFCIRGLAVGEVGAADIQADGAIFHMRSLEDFPGKYSAVSLGATLIKGGSSAMLKNRRGVTMQLESRVTGLRFNISASGVEISLSGTRGCPQSNARKR